MLSLFSVASITSGASGGRADARAICRWWWRHPRSNSLMAPFWRVFYWRGWRHPPSLPPSLPPSFLLLLPGCNLRVEIGAIFCWPSTKQILQFPLVFLIPFRDILLHFFFFNYYNSFFFFFFFNGNHFFFLAKMIIVIAIIWIKDNGHNLLMVL